MTEREGETCTAASYTARTLCEELRRRYPEVWEHIRANEVAVFYHCADSRVSARDRDEIPANAHVLYGDDPAIPLLAGPAMMYDRKIVLFAHHHYNIPNESELRVVRLTR